jgi:hypothetical protein
VPPAVEKGAENDQRGGVPRQPAPLEPTHGTVEADGDEDRQEQQQQPRRHQVQEIYRGKADRHREQLQEQMIPAVPFPRLRH